jgi:hypothetical protein
VFAEQAAIDQRRQILAALGGKLETVLDWIGWNRHFLRCELMGARNLPERSCNERSCKASQKKEQGGKPCSKNCVDPIYPKILI